MVKSVTSKHTPIAVSVRKICEEIKNEQEEHKREDNKQQINTPRFIDQVALKDLVSKITHNALDLIPQELDAAKKMVHEINYDTESMNEPSSDGCINDCELPP